jgi:hypothetical protein
MRQLGGEHISSAALKRQEEVLPAAKLEQRRYNIERIGIPGKRRKYHCVID